MTCERLEQRLYDEDVRQALLGQTGTPADLRSHLEGCAACRTEWSAAREDALLLREGLEEAPPPHLRVAIASTWTQRRLALLRAIDWAAALSSAGAAGALAAGALHLVGTAVPLSWSAAAFALAATCAFTVQVTAGALSDAASGRA
jgi:predicted anti-sigma-YlaC factor YlaD